MSTKIKPSTIILFFFIIIIILLVFAIPKLLTKGFSEISEKKNNEVVSYEIDFENKKQDLFYIGQYSSHKTNKHSDSMMTIRTTNNVSFNIFSKYEDVITKGDLYYHDNDNNEFICFHNLELTKCFSVFSKIDLSK